jgi:hypothetical protein
VAQWRMCRPPGNACLAAITANRAMARGSHLLGVYQSLWGPQLFRIECRHRIGKGGPSAITSSVKLPEVALRALQTPIGPARRSPVCTRKVWVGEALSCTAKLGLRLGHQR